MNVTTIGQGPGSVETLRDARQGEESSGRAPAPALDVARLAWFDLNGDGHIDNGNPLSGGDGTLIVTAQVVPLQVYSREAARPQVQLPADNQEKDDERSVERSRPAPDAPEQVRTRQAIQAYERTTRPEPTAQESAVA